MEISEEKVKIDSLTHEEIAYLWRHATLGHPYFDNSKPYFQYFESRFKELGGMTVEISKKIGW